MHVMLYDTFIIKKNNNNKGLDSRKKIDYIK